MDEHAPANFGEDGEAGQARFILELRSKGIIDPALLTAFERVPRAVFMPDAPRALLYDRIALPIPCGEEAADAFTLARLLALLDLRPGLRVLEIGTGTGFFAGLMASLGAAVISVERWRTLISQAGAHFETLGLSTIRLRHADGLARCDDGETFDRLIVHGAMDVVPQHLLGRLVHGGIGLGCRLRNGQTRLTMWRIDLTGHPVETDLGPARTTRMRAGLPKVL